jgi:hypothetical protein
MQDVAVTVTFIVLIALAVWIVGSIALRIAGVLLALVGLVGMALGDIEGLIVVAIGLLLWLGGHWLYGVRHHTFSSPLARRIFLQTPLRRIDPTRGWGIPTVSVDEQYSDR